MFIEEEFFSFMRHRACKAAQGVSSGTPGTSSFNIVMLFLLTANEGTKYEGVRFCTAILDTVSTIGMFYASTHPSSKAFDQNVICRQCRTRRHPFPASAFIPRSYSTSSSPHPALTHSLRDVRRKQRVPLVRCGYPRFDFGSNDEAEADVDGPAYFQRYTAVAELAKCCEREMSEVQVKDALEAAGVLKGM